MGLPGEPCPDVDYWRFSVGRKSSQAACIDHDFAVKGHAVFLVKFVASAGEVWLIHTNLRALKKDIDRTWQCYYNDINKMILST